MWPQPSQDGNQSAFFNNNGTMNNSTQPPEAGGFGAGSTFQSGPTQNAVFGQPAGFGAPPQGPVQRMKFGSQATGSTGGDGGGQSQPTTQGFGGFGGQASQGMDADEMKKKERAARFLTVSTSAIDARKAEGQQQQQDQQRDTGEDTMLAKKAIIGTCEDMCPAAERERRQNMSDIQIFERVYPDNMNVTSAELAVKRFARTVDDPHPSDFRTRGALQRTMIYLRSLLDREDVRFGLVHKFLWDRYRSIRQDLYIQGITDRFAISIFEEVVRFHVLCEHELSGDDQNVTDMEGFNSHLNMEQMNKALISLNDMYEKAAEKGEHCPNESEFRSYHLLSLMSQHGKFKGDQQAFLSTIQSLRQEVRDSANIQWVLQLRSAFVFGNFARFFTLIKKAPYLLACLSHVYFPQMRSKCFRVMSESIVPGRPAMLEASWLMKTLLLDSEEEALQLGKQHGFESSLDDRGAPAVVLVKGDFVPLPTPVVRYPSKFISRMAPGKRSTVVTSSDNSIVANQPVSEEEEQRRKQEMQRQQEQQMLLLQEERKRQQRVREEAERQRKMQEEENAKIEAERRRIALEEEARKERLLEEKRQEDRRKQEARIAAEEEARRLAAIEAEKQRRIAEAEEARRRAAEAEARRLAELERQRREEEERRRKEEEERRRRLIDKLKEAIISKKYWDIWLEETRYRMKERERARLAAINLKSCRVGIVSRSNKRSRNTMVEMEWEDDIDNSPSKKQCCDEMLLKLSELIHPILAEKDGNAAEIHWKATVLSFHDNFVNDPLARYVHKFAALDACKTRVTEQENDEIVYQDSQLENSHLNACLHFRSKCELNIDTLKGSSAIIMTVEDYSSREAEIKSFLNLSSKWKGPSIPILILSRGIDPCEFSKENMMARIISIESLAGSPNDRLLLEDGLRWSARYSPEEPSFTVVPLKQTISQGIRSFLREEEVSKGLQIVGHMAHDKAIELVLEAIDAAFKSTEASWAWPPQEFDLDALSDWYTVEKYSSLVHAVKEIYTEMNQAGREYLSLLSMNALMDRACPKDIQLVIPDKISSPFSRILFLQNIPSPNKMLSEDRSRRPQTQQQSLAPIHSNSDSVARNAKLRHQIHGLEEELNLQRMLDKDMVRESSRYSIWKPMHRPDLKKNTRQSVAGDDDLNSRVNDEKEASTSFVNRLRKLRDMMFF